MHGWMGGFDDGQMIDVCLICCRSAFTDLEIKTSKRLRIHRILSQRNCQDKNSKGQKLNQIIQINDSRK